MASRVASLFSKVSNHRKHLAGLWAFYSNGTPYADNTLLAGCVLLGVQDAPEGAAVCKLSDGSWVGFYQVIPLTENELEYKIQHSTDEMLEYMEDVDHVVYFQRPDTKFESH